MRLFKRPKVKVHIYYENEETGFPPIMVLTVNEKDMEGLETDGKWVDDRVGERYEMFLGNWKQRKSILELLRRCGLRFEGEV